MRYPVDISLPNNGMSWYIRANRGCLTKKVSDHWVFSHLTGWSDLAGGTILGIRPSRLFSLVSLTPEVHMDQACSHQAWDCPSIVIGIMTHWPRTFLKTAILLLWNNNGSTSVTLGMPRTGDFTNLLEEL